MMSVTVDAKTVTVNLSSFDEWEKNHPKALSQDDKDRLDAMGQVGQYRTQETLGSPFEDQNATIMVNDRYAWRLRGGQKTCLITFAFQVNPGKDCRRDVRNRHSGC